MLNEGLRECDGTKQIDLELLANIVYTVKTRQPRPLDDGEGETADLISSTAPTPVRFVPALFTRTSTWPYALSDSSAACLIASSGPPRSSTTGFAPASSNSFGILARERTVATTCIDVYQRCALELVHDDNTLSPRDRAYKATARPNPELVPVTTRTRSDMLNELQMPRSVFVYMLLGERH